LFPSLTTSPIARFRPTDDLPKDASPSPSGYSTGRWQGDPLMVETNGLRDGTGLDRRGSSLKDAARLTERFRRVSDGLLETELTIDDSKAYTRPFTSKATTSRRRPRTARQLLLGLGRRKSRHPRVRK